MAHLFDQVWPLCDLAGGSKWGWEGVSAVLYPSSYSKPLGSLLIPGASRPTSKLLHFSPMTRYRWLICLSRSGPFGTLQGALNGAGRGDQLRLTLLLIRGS